MVMDTNLSAFGGIQSEYLPQWVDISTVIPISPLQ